MKDAKPRVPQSDTPAKTLTRPSDARRERMAQSFANIVGVLMRDPGFKNLRLADLEWLVIPAILSGQWRLAQGAARPTKSDTASAEEKASMYVPVATALWASVSPEIDKRLSENLDKPLTLRPNEWLSGQHIWLIAVAGDRRYLRKFLTTLADSDFKGKTVKMRVNDPDGKVVVRQLTDATKEAAGASA